MKAQAMYKRVYREDSKARGDLSGIAHRLPKDRPILSEAASVRERLVAEYLQAVMAPLSFYAVREYCLCYVCGYNGYMVWICLWCGCAFLSACVLSCLSACVLSCLVLFGEWCGFGGGWGWRWGARRSRGISAKRGGMTPDGRSDLRRAARMTDMYTQDEDE